MHTLFYSDPLAFLPARCRMMAALLSLFDRLDAKGVFLSDSFGGEWQNKPIRSDASFDDTLGHDDRYQRLACEF